MSKKVLHLHKFGAVFIGLTLTLRFVDSCLGSQLTPVGCYLPAKMHCYSMAVSNVAKVNSCGLIGLKCKLK